MNDFSAFMPQETDEQIAYRERVEKIAEWTRQNPRPLPHGQADYHTATAAWKAAFDAKFGA